MKGYSTLVYATLENLKVLINILVRLETDEAQKNGSASDVILEETIHETGNEKACENEGNAEETVKNKETTEKLSTKGSEDSLAALDQVDIDLNFQTDDDMSTNLLDNLQLSEVNNSESDLLFTQDDGNLADNETESEVKEAEVERTSETNPTIEESQERSSETLESDFVDAAAINGIEMSPGIDVNNDHSEESSQGDFPEKKTLNEEDETSKQESTIVCNDASQHSLADNSESPNEENPVEGESQRLTDTSQDELIPSSADAAADSSDFETPKSSETLPSTSSGNQSEVVVSQPTVTINGVEPRNSVTDGAPIPPPRKNKKKAVSKGLSSSSLGACFPIACAGNMSPTFNLSRVDSVYGGSVRSRLVL